MVLPEADWKNQPRHLVDWFIVVVAVVLLAVYLSLWVTDGGLGYLGIGLVFVAWLIVFFTDAWQPILYLFVALAVALITLFLVRGGFWDQPLGQVAILFNSVFLLTSIYLFFYEDQPQ